MLTLGNSYSNIGNQQAAILYLKEGIGISMDHKILVNVSLGYSMISDVDSVLGHFNPRINCLA